MPPSPASDIAERVWFTAEQAMDYLQLSERALRSAYLEGDLKVARPARRGSRVRFHRTWLDAYIKGEPMPEDAPAAAAPRPRRRTA